MIGRIDTDQLGLILATAWAQRGTCARRRVGCILVDAWGHEIGTGYNGPPSDEPHCIDTGGERDRRCAGADLPSGTGLDTCEAVHAEMNAVMFCRDPYKIATAYVTHSPCLGCVKVLMNTSCRRIIFANRYAHDEAASARWMATGPGEPYRTWEHVPLTWRLLNDRGSCVH